MTRANRRNSCFGSRCTTYRCWIWSRNMTRVNRKKIVNWDWTYSHSVLIIGSKHDSRQPKKKNWRIGSRPAAYLVWIWAPNMTRANRRNSCICSRLKPICAKFELETWLSPAKEIRVLALDPQPMCAEYGLKTWIAPTEGIRVLSLDLQPICVEYGLSTWLAQTEQILVLALDLQPICWIWSRNMIRTNRRNTCIGDRPTAYPWLNMGSEQDSRQPKNTCIGARPAAYLSRIRARNMTRANRKIRALAVDIQPIRVECGIETWLVPTEEIRVLAFGLQPFGAEYGLETWLAPTEENRVLVLCADCWL